LNGEVRPLLRRRGGRSLPSSLRWLALSAFGAALFGLIVFNYGFQMIRFPPSGAGVPLMEILMFVAAPFVLSRTVMRDFSRSSVFVPLCLWIIIGGARVMSSLPEFGMKAVRDGLPVLESIFLVFGFAMASQKDVIKSYLRYLPILVFTVFGYALLAPFSSQLVPLSPTLPSTQGIPVPIFFLFGNSPTILIPAAAFLWVRGNATEQQAIWLPAIFVGVALVLFPSRSLLLQIVSMLAVLSIVGGKDQVRSFVSVIGIGFLALAGIFLLSYFGVKVVGRLGAMSPEDYFRLIREIMIWENFERGTTLSSGGSERIDWWLDIINTGLSSVQNFVFGVGYGEPLMEGVFHGGKITREPHNSWISVFGRSGIFGLFAFTYLCFAIVRLGLSQLRQRVDSVLFGPFVVFCFMVVVCTLVLGLGETPFVMPFTTIPFYFCAGILARMAQVRSSKVPSIRDTASPRDG